MRGTGRTVLRALRVAPLLGMAPLLGAAGSVAAAGSEFRSEYVGQETRGIKSLSAADIEELRAGGGWGLAKAAELNGLPGPKHILEMKEQIALTPGQESRVVALYEEMRREAMALGARLIEHERELDRGFVQRTIDEKALGEILGRIAEVYKSLRQTHLSAHLKTPGILTGDQIATYNRLRGYTSDDPCANVPEGHDPVMWRRHNNCD